MTDTPPEVDAALWHLNEAMRVLPHTGPVSVGPPLTDIEAVVDDIAERFGTLPIPAFKRHEARRRDRLHAAEAVLHALRFPRRSDGRVLHIEAAGSGGVTDALNHYESLTKKNLSRLPNPRYGGED